VKNEYFGLVTMIGTMLALGIWLYHGVSPAEKNPGKLRIFLTLTFGFTLTVGGFLTFAFAREWGSHFAAINMMLFGVACLQYTFRTLEMYRVTRVSVADVSEDHDNDQRSPFDEKFKTYPGPQCGIYLISNAE